MEKNISNGQDNRTVYYIIIKGNNNFISIKNDGQKIINASEGTSKKEEPKTIFYRIKRIKSFLESLHLGIWMIDVIPMVLTAIVYIFQSPQ